MWDRAGRLHERFACTMMNALTMATCLESRAGKRFVETQHLLRWRLMPQRVKNGMFFLQWYLLTGHAVRNENIVHTKDYIGLYLDIRTCMKIVERVRANRMSAGSVCCHE
jgi:hypothetical protein